MVYQSNLLGDFWTSYRQRRATGGRPLTSSEMRGLLDPMMGLEFQRGEAAAERARQQGNFNRQMSLQEQAVKDQARAAKIGGCSIRWSAWAGIPRVQGIAVGRAAGSKHLGV